ncbi:MAG: InlB B-repeat-containing protein, partial [Candidatus Bathyarchaeota archaeon]|nr:InlB B-repeat-containing protein [Candidatus Bathyarchaeota archaeon]
MVKKLSISVLVLLILTGLALQPAAIIVKGQYPVPYKLTVQVNNHLAGTTSPSPGVTYVDYGLSVQVKATPHTGYIFNGWYLNGVYQHKLTTITITMLNDNLLMAAFSQEAVALTITANPPEGGVINPPPGTLQYQYGSLVEVTAQPNQDYVFNGWYLDGQYMGTQSTITVEMTNNRELGAFFAGGSTPTEPPVELPPSTITVSCESYSKYSEFDV